MSKIKFEDLLGTGAHFGHVTRKWNPNFKKFIAGQKNGIHIIDVNKTIENFKHRIKRINKNCFKWW